MFEFLKRHKGGSASIAKSRLQITLTSDRNASIAYLDELKDDILALVRKYAPNSRVNIDAKTNRNNTLDIEVNVSNI